MIVLAFVALCVLWVAVSFGAAYKAGVMQARWIKLHGTDNDPVPPVLCAVAAFVAWPVWLVAVLVWRAGSAVNAALYARARVPEASKIEALERSTR